MDGSNGILLINKPKGITSYDVIRQLKKYFPKKYKLGHGGTLDPFACGLLIILVGKGTKLMQDLNNLDKSYMFKTEFGFETDTQDITGKIITKTNTKLTQEEIEHEIEQKFIGQYLQTPPSFSAKKIKGVPSYKYARKGEIKKLEPKLVNISSFKIIEYNWPNVTFNATVSSGTYIRTLVVDLANNLNSCATTVELKRYKIGRFELDQAIPITEIDEKIIKENLISLDMINEYLK